MNTIRLITLAILSALLLSCGNEDIIENHTDILLPSVIKYEDYSTDKTLFYTYDDQNRLSKVEFVEIFKNGSSYVDENTGAYRFTYNEKGELALLTYEGTFQSKEKQSIFTYDYDNNTIQEECRIRSEYNYFIYSDTTFYTYHFDDVKRQSNRLCLGDEDWYSDQWHMYNKEGNSCIYKNGESISKSGIYTYTYDEMNGIYKNDQTPSWIKPYLLFFVYEFSAFVNNPDLRVHSGQYGKTEYYDIKYNTDNYP